VESRRLYLKGNILGYGLPKGKLENYLGYH